MTIFSRKIFILSGAVLILIIIIFSGDILVCQSRADSSQSSFKICIKRLLGRDNPPPPPILRPERILRFIEGWSLQDMANYLANEGLWSQAEFLATAKTEGFMTDAEEITTETATANLKTRFSFLESKPETASLHGYLFPDTYRIFADARPQDLIIRMLENFDSKLTPAMRQAIADQGKTIHEIIIMASIVEKEAPINYTTGDNVDAKIVAGVFWQRISNQQPLQSCATLAYILGVDKDRYSEADTRVDSPYNTYLHRGLPPGPIANPGILAIEAAIFPTETDYNFFLTPTGTREMVYARTYADHLQNIAKYLE